MYDLDPFASGATYNSHAQMASAHSVFGPQTNDGDVTVVAPPPGSTGPYDPSTPGSGGGDGGFASHSDGGGGSGGDGSSGSGPASDSGQFTGLAPADTYSKTPTPCEQQLIDTPQISQAIQTAISGSHSSAPNFSDRAEQGFQVWKNTAGDITVVTGAPGSDGHSPNKDYTVFGASPGPDYHVIFSFHTHPFAGPLPTTDPVSKLTYYGPPSNGDEEIINGGGPYGGGFGEVVDKDGNTYFFGTPPSC